MLGILGGFLTGDGMSGRMRSLMSDVTRILEAAPRREALDAGELLPLVYKELRRVAASKLGHEAANHTLDLSFSAGTEAYAFTFG